MRKTKKRNPSKVASAAATEQRVNPETEARRKRERAAKRNRTFRDWGVSIAAVLVLGFGLFQYFAASAASEDLTLVGQGTPYVVQVHDRNCIPCGVLKGQTAKALKQFDKTELGYVIADLNKSTGARFANRYSAGQTTLLLFDGDGALQRRIVGEQEPDSLVEQFSSALGVRPKT